MTNDTHTHTHTPRAESTRTFLRRALVSRPASTDVHFHNGPQGAPAVCDDPRCASPRLEV
jgi:hypothetical protein